MLSDYEDPLHAIPGSDSYNPSPAHPIHPTNRHVLNACPTESVREAVDAFTRGQIVGMACAGSKASAIADSVRKTNGGSATKRAINQTIA